MADRRVTATRKDNDGDTLALCKEGEWWSPRQKTDAIRDIENGTHRYYVKDNTGNEVDIHVVNGPNGKYLRTDPDKTSKNNLEELPDC